jgi:hypothetical protein
MIKTSTRGGLFLYISELAYTHRKGVKMGNSFKLQKGGPAKSQAKSGGVFLAILGVVVGLLIYWPVGIGMIILGLILFAASFAATE